MAEARLATHHNEAKTQIGAIYPEVRAVELIVEALLVHSCMAQKLQNVSATLTRRAIAVLSVSEGARRHAVISEPQPGEEP